MNASSAVAHQPSLRSGASPFLTDCLKGLMRARKSIPCKWLYDQEGSRLFELICETPEYYVPRIETKLLSEAAPEIAGLLRPDTALVEFGSGASRKTRILLDELDSLTCYVPIDISSAELARATAAIEADYPWLEVMPIVGDFTMPVDLGHALLFNDRLGFFPGSTLGNFAPDEAMQFLADVRNVLGLGSRFLIGVDLIKDPAQLRAAYDDVAGVTAAFNRNILVRANRELGSDFDPEQFDHRAVWNEDVSRIEMHLVSRVAQTVKLAGDILTLAEGEAIHTENSYKYSEAALIEISQAGGWRMERCWLSSDPAYAIALLQC